MVAYIHDHAFQMEERERIMEEVHMSRNETRVRCGMFWVAMLLVNGGSWLDFVLNSLWQHDMDSLAHHHSHVDLESLGVER